MINGSRRVVVTGFGAVSALGSSAHENWRAARDGRSAIAVATIDPGPNGPPANAYPLAAPAPGYEAIVHDHFGRPVCDVLDPFASLALCASLEGLKQAGLIGADVLDARTAVVFGHGMGGLATLEKSYERFYGRKSPRTHPTTVPRVMVSAAVSAVAMGFSVHGPVFAISSACSSSSHAIAQGASLIAMGLVDVAITGGSEAIATPGSMRAWESIQALSKTTCRPFSAQRDGMVMGEGGAALILEEREHARARGATILGELVGMGMTSDAVHITQPALDGPVSAMRQAIAGLQDADDILISAHGTGTALNDQNEAAAIRAVFPGRRPAVIATKSAHGHLIGGSAALQAVIALQGLNEGLAPPVLNYLAPDPDCDVDLVLGEARPIKSSHLLLNAFAFGGLNVALAFAKGD
jgi:nodulation protein E